MVEKYKLQFHLGPEVHSIHWAHDLKDYVPGSFRARAILEETNVSAHNKEHFQRLKYTTPMDIAEVYSYIKQRPQMFGKVGELCVGLILEDICENREFALPIKLEDKE